MAVMRVSRVTVGDASGTVTSKMRLASMTVYGGNTEVAAVESKLRLASMTVYGGNVDSTVAQSKLRLASMTVYGGNVVEAPADAKMRIERVWVYGNGPTAATKMRVSSVSVFGGAGGAPPSGPVVTTPKSALEAGEVMSFSALSNDPDGVVVSYAGVIAENTTGGAPVLVNLGNGSFTVQAPVQLAQGTFKIKITATDNQGNVSPEGTALITSYAAVEVYLVDGVLTPSYEVLFV